LWDSESGALDEVRHFDYCDFKSRLS
jgi:hypothetical protein